MTETKQAQHYSTIYVVTAKSWEEDKENSDDKVSLNFGILRLFTNKNDVKKYMQRYYDDIEPTGGKSIDTYENSTGRFRIKIKAWTDNIKGAVSLDGHQLENRTHYEVMECRDIAPTTALDIETIDLGNDYYNEFYG